MDGAMACIYPIFTKAFMPNTSPTPILHSHRQASSSPSTPPPPLTELSSLAVRQHIPGGSAKVRAPTLHVARFAFTWRGGDHVSLR